MAFLNVLVALLVQPTVGLLLPPAGLVRPSSLARGGMVRMNAEDVEVVVDEADEAPAGGAAA